MGFVDLHCHILPALDDGSKSLEESLELGGLLHNMGFEVVCATPHQKVGSFVPTAEAIATAHSTVSASVPVELRLGAENFWDELFLERAFAGATATQPMYTGGQAFLFEIHPRMAPPRLEEALFQMRLRGQLPVMAHPERYHAFWDDWKRLERLAQSVALVVDLGALVGAHGVKECETAKRLVKSGVAHAVATDTHSSADTRTAAQGMAWIEKNFGSETLVRLLDENPRVILQGGLPG